MALLWLAVVCIVLALVMGLAGFRGLAGLTMDIAWILILLFVVIAIASFFF